MDYLLPAAASTKVMGDMATPVAVFLLTILALTNHGQRLDRDLPVDPLDVSVILPDAIPVSTMYMYIDQLEFTRKQLIEDSLLVAVYNCDCIIDHNCT